ncbi:MAG: hypothetical protein QGG40_08220 [Myxococcota bacterium]|nr:hypothetical protein [Myxococcota bacterium]
MYLLLISTALATKVSFHEVPCPMGGSPVRIYTKVSANNDGGYDSDLATYSSRGQFRTYAVSTCPDSLFSLYGTDMESSLSPDDKLALQEELDRATEQLVDPEEPKVWERYEIAARMYRVLGRDPLFLGQLLLAASWTARDDAVGVYIGLDGPEAARKLLDAGVLELEKDLTPAQRRTVLFNLARVAHRGGFNAQRDSYLDGFEATGALDANERQALDRFRHIAHQVEPRLQDQAISAFREGLQTPPPAADRLMATYKLADLLRRRDQTVEALGLFEEVASAEATPNDLRRLAQTMVAELVE